MYYLRIQCPASRHIQSDHQRLIRSNCRCPSWKLLWVIIICIRIEVLLLKWYTKNTSVKYTHRVTKITVQSTNTCTILCHSYAGNFNLQYKKWIHRITCERNISNKNKNSLSSFIWVSLWQFLHSAVCLDKHIHLCTM